MKELEKLDKDGNVLFCKKYTKQQADYLLKMYDVYGGTNKTMFREKITQAPRKTNKTK